MVQKKSKKIVKKNFRKKIISKRKTAIKRVKIKIKRDGIKKKNINKKVKEAANFSKKRTSIAKKSTNTKKKSAEKRKINMKSPVSKIKKKKTKVVNDDVKLTRKVANRPMLLFIDCEDSKLKKIVFRLKRTNWVKNVHILSGLSKHRIALYTHVGNSRMFEKHMSYLHAMDGIHSVFEYPAFKHATNGVKMGQHPHGAYFFLKCEDEMNDLWEEFKHSDNLVEMHEVPGEYDFIMYTEGKSYDTLMNKWSNLCNTHKLKEIDAAFTVSESLIH